MSSYYDDSGDDERSKRPRSPSFPYLSLSECIKLTDKLYQEAQGNEARLDDLAEVWNLSSAKGSLLRYVAAMSAFGLLDTRGSGVDRKARVSELAKRIVRDNRPGVRDDLLAEAARKPKIINQVYSGTENFDAWGRSRPNDKIAESALVFDLNFTAEAARKFINVYDDALTYLPGFETNSQQTTDENELEKDASDEASLHLPAIVPQAKDKQDSLSGAQPILGLNEFKFEIVGDRAIINAMVNIDGLDALEKKIKALRLILD